MIRRCFVPVFLLACALLASAAFAVDLPTQPAAIPAAGAEIAAERVDADVVPTVEATTGLFQEPLSWLELDVAGWVAVGAQGADVQPMAAGPGGPLASAQCPAGRSCTSTEQCRAFCCDQIPGTSGGVCAQNLANPSVQCCFCGFFQGCGE